MSAIQRQSRLVPNPKDSNHVFESSDSPIVISHASFVGLGISIVGSADPTITVAVGGSLDGSFDDVVTMEGEGDWRWPNTDGMNRLYNARYVQITWDSGSIQVFQKG